MFAALKHGPTSERCEVEVVVGKERAENCSKITDDAKPAPRARQVPGRERIPTATAQTASTPKSCLSRFLTTSRSLHHRRKPVALAVGQDESRATTLLQFSGSFVLGP